MAVKKHLVFAFFLVLTTISYDSAAVTVKPALCPTNKIAPHRRISTRQSPRTFGYVASLFHHDGPYQDGPDSPSLQEEPQTDDSDDCGDIEDYDENDLSAVTPQRKRDYVENRFFFGLNNNQRPPPVRPPQHGPPNKPMRPPPPLPVRPQRPMPPTRPPYHSGGMFGDNYYRPPPYSEHQPSNHIKPVYEDPQEPPQATYRPGLVGGSLGQIVGLTQIRPTTPPQSDENQASTRRPYPSRQRPQRPRRLNDQTVIGSFIDLLFK